MGRGMGRTCFLNLLMHSSYSWLSFLKIIEAVICHTIMQCSVSGHHFWMRMKMKKKSIAALLKMSLTVAFKRSDPFRLGYNGDHVSSWMWMNVFINSHLHLKCCVEENPVRLERLVVVAGSSWVCVNLHKNVNLHWPTLSKRLINEAQCLSTASCNVSFPVLQMANHCFYELQITG